MFPASNPLLFKYSECFCLKRVRWLSSGQLVRLCTSHSVGISPLLSTMQSGPQGSDMSNIPPCHSPHGNTKISTQLPWRHLLLLFVLFTSTQRHTHLTHSTLVNILLGPLCNLAFYKTKHSLWGIKHLLGPLHICYFSPHHYLLHSPTHVWPFSHFLLFFYLVLLLRAIDQHFLARVGFSDFHQSPFDMEMKWLRSMSGKLRQNTSVSGSDVFFPFSLLFVKKKLATL